MPGIRLADLCSSSASCLWILLTGVQRAGVRILMKSVSLVFYGLYLPEKPLPDLRSLRFSLCFLLDILGVSVYNLF